ncbi:MAG: 6-bladed beta-propeller, partial [Bacteroidales bacterium]
MKLPTSIIITCVLSVLVASCTNRDPGLGKNPEVIKINIDDKKRPLLNVSIEDVVPLETSQNSLLGYQAKVKYFNNRFYILNNNRFEQPTLFVFDERGHFLKKTIRGKGPGEVIEPFAFTIN